MSNQVELTVDRSGWKSGPWDGEPDRLQWKTAAGLVAMIIRVPESGHLCGYVAVESNHPDYGADYDNVDVDVHGGLTYGSQCAGHVCHIPEPGEPDDVFWFGFDCAHCGDLAPGRIAMFGNHAGLAYRTVEYLKTQCESLAQQLQARAVK